MTEYQDLETNTKRGDRFVPTYYYNYGGRSYRFRQGSVEGIRCRRASWRRYYRCPSHIAMRKAYFKALYDGLPLRQRWVEIPDPWEDWPYIDHCDRTWKRYRKTQYKVVDKRERTAITEK